MKPFRLYLCIELPPSQKIGFSKRSQYVIIKTTSIKLAFRIFTREILKVKRAYNKEKIRDRYYYYDSAIYIERMNRARKSVNYPDSKIIHSGFFLELCRECIYLSVKKDKKRDNKSSKND